MSAIEAHPEVGEHVAPRWRGCEAEVGAQDQQVRHRLQHRLLPMQDQRSATE